MLFKVCLLVFKAGKKLVPLCLNMLNWFNKTKSTNQVYIRLVSNMSRRLAK